MLFYVPLFQKPPDASATTKKDRDSQSPQLDQSTPHTAAKTPDSIQHVQQTYYLERRTFL